MSKSTLTEDEFEELLSIIASARADVRQLEAEGASVDDAADVFTRMLCTIGQRFGANVEREVREMMGEACEPIVLH